jgi:SAM-dependent methyltransferase
MSTNKRCIGCSGIALLNYPSKYICSVCSLQFWVDGVGLNYASTYSDSESLYYSHFRNIDSFQTMPIDKLMNALLPFEARLHQIINEKMNYSGIIDLGCGTGRFLRAMENVIDHVRGYEVATAIVDRLQQYGRVIQKGGIEDFLLKNETSDVVTLLEVVEHLHNPRQLIQDILNVKSPKLLAVAVPMWDVRRKFDSEFLIHDRPPNHLSWWNAQALNALLKHPRYSVNIEVISEKRISLLKKFVKDLMRGNNKTNISQWIRAFINPPPFWILGLAQKINEN